jgi:glucosamine--fructose-6-phosphate aminotransferase (isomerizing)
MAIEALEATDGARRQIATCAGHLTTLGQRLRAEPPRLVVTCARGSSDHASTFGKYVIETITGCLVASVGPSVGSIYQRVPSGFDGALFVVVSQSGRSPDLLEQTTAARSGGALVVGIINDESSPLAALCDVVIPLCAGEERSVAATKSFLLSGLAFLQLVAAWTDDPTLRDAITRAPDAFAAACALDWATALAPLATATSAYVLGRGVGLGAAQEVALKLKEVCRLHAEAFSAAELHHGPITLVGAGFPIVALGQDDATAPAMRDTLSYLVGLGAAVFSTLDVAGTSPLPTPPGLPAILTPLCNVQSFYLAVSHLAAARGIDPDAPRHLRKITETT